MTFVEDVIDEYNRLNRINAENVAGWNFMTSLSFPPIVIFSYLLFVFHSGPRIMENRPAYSLSYLISCYNICQIFFNVFLFTRMCRYMMILLDSSNSLQCIEIEQPGSDIFSLVVETMWLFVANKTLDLLDTVFFVLRKKQSQISFLHVYHHLLTFCGVWFLARYAPGGLIAVFAFMNTIVHTAMYTYYFASAQASLKRYAVHFKKFVTQMQLIQFTIAGVHGFYALADTTCSYPRSLVCFGLFQDILMMYLFGKFYARAYLDEGKKIAIQNIV